MKKYFQNYMWLLIFFILIIGACQPESEGIDGGETNTNQIETNVTLTNISVLNMTNSLQETIIFSTNYISGSYYYSITNYENLLEHLLITNYSGVITNSLTNRTVFTNYNYTTNTQFTNTTSFTNYGSMTPLNSANYTDYNIQLEEYGYKIIFLSNHTGTVDSSSGWWKDAVVYQIFVRSFKDSNGDGIGDLDGLTSKLDYIQNLGCTAIWTLPIFDSPSIHGYDISDYYAIESDYGSMTDFEEYVSAAHTKNIKVVLDLVLNHSSAEHSWFQNSRSSTTSTYRDWYVWTNATLTQLENDGWQLPWGGGSASSVWHSYDSYYYYGAFWDGMPDLNLRNREVRDEFTNVAKYWLDKGIDGYRLDAVRYGIEDGPYPNQADTADNIAWWTELETAVRSFNSSAMMVGEAWTDPDSKITNYWNGGSGLDQVFSFHYFYKMKDSLINEDKTHINSYLTHHNSLSTPWHFFGPFMDNHDEPDGNNRLMDTIGVSEAKMKLAAVMTMTLPGTPYIYYGTELGMKKHSTVSGDTAKRTPMHWDDTSKAGFTTGTPWVSIADNTDPYNAEDQISDPDSIYNHFREMIALRNSSQTLCRADVVSIQNDQTAIVSYIRPGTDGTYLVVMNLSSNTVSANLDFTGSGINSGGTYPLVQVSGTVNYDSTYPSMYLRGSFNSWSTSTMSLVSNHLWSTTVNMPTTSDAFKFDVHGDWTTNWGDNPPVDGTADLQGSNITVGVSGDVTIMFNDSTLEYFIN